MPKNNAELPKLIATKPASQFEIREPEFAWFPWLPLRKLTILQGESGIGKSTLLMTVAAMLSNGEQLPFQEKGVTPQSGDTLYFINEDTVADTINPRLVSMGANRDRIHIVNEKYAFGHDLRPLEETIRHLGVRAVIFDPITAFLNVSHNMNTAQGVGNLLRDLGKVAERTGTAIIAVCHFTKNGGGSEIHRHLGSSDIVNAARSVLSVTCVDEESQTMVVKHLKSSLARPAAPFYYRIVGNGVIEFIEGDGAAIGGIEENTATKNEKAQDYILSLVANGPVESTAAFSMALETGAGRGTIYSAKKNAGIVSKKIGDEWFWCHPCQDVNAVGE